MTGKKKILITTSLLRIFRITSKRPNSSANNKLNNHTNPSRIANVGTTKYINIDPTNITIVNINNRYFILKGEDFIFYIDN